MAYVRKTKDVYCIEAYYEGYGWAFETAEETYKDAKAQAKCYRENTNTPIRIVKHRVKKEEKI